VKWYNKNTISFSILLIIGVYYKFLGYRFWVLLWIEILIRYHIKSYLRENGGENDKACG